jgi:putative isomerase
MTQNINIKHVPWSRFGSYLAFNFIDASRQDAPRDIPHGLWLRCVAGDCKHPEVFRLDVVENGASVPFETQATPSQLKLKTQRGEVRLCFVTEDAILVEGNGAGLRLQLRPGLFHSAVPDGKNWNVNAWTAFRNYMLVPHRGELKVDAPWKVGGCEHVIADFLPDASGTFRASVEQFTGTWQPANFSSFDETVAHVQSEYSQFVNALPQVPREFEATREHAAYVMWASTVAPRGHFKRPATLMSKNWMYNVWSWDHCFNALALAQGNPQLAWDQFMVVFDHQLPSGQLPDFINDTQILRNFVKQPIHGWTFEKMQQSHPFFRQPEIVEEAYNRLKRWTNWWFDFRDPQQTGFPQLHHGNDAWDNGTVFDLGFPAIAPDTLAHLSNQMRVLASLADGLNNGEGNQWRERAAQCEASMMQLWNGEKFVVKHALSGESSGNSDSVYECLPAVLGENLPSPAREKMATRVKRHLTRWGLATENPQSPRYISDGYWRGPIWAPPTLLICDGLQRMGEEELARDIACKFCELVAQGGMAENFDALSGEPLRDRAYTWTASVFLSLASEFLPQK